LLAAGGSSPFSILHAHRPCARLSFLEIALPMLSAERQMRRVRQEYVRALMRQPPGWHDVNKTGEVASKMAENTLLMSAGMGDKLSQGIQYTITFIAGAWGVALCC
jgi:ABC-type multidrug transport system fused ATPase/permease subunit